MELRTEVEIDAAPEAVWRVLVDLPRYPEWNPFITSIKGELSKGKRLDVTLSPADGSERTSKATITRFEEGREIGWRDKLWFAGLFDGEHFVQVLPADGGKTRVVTAADYSGLLVQYMGNTLTQHARGFVGMNQALKRRVESLR